MEQHNSTSTASQATPANTPAPKAQAARKFSTASASEKTAALVKWLEESKARDVVALDVAGKSPCMDVVIVVTASSLRIESLWKESPALYGEMPAVSPRHAEPAGDED